MLSQNEEAAAQGWDQAEPISAVLQVGVLERK